MTLDVRDRLFRQMQRLSVTYHDTMGAADSAYRTLNDAPMLRSFGIDGMIPLATSILTLGAMIIVMVLLDWQLALIALLVSPAMFLLIVVFRPRIRAGWRKYRNSETAAMAVAVPIALTGVALGLPARQREPWRGELSAKLEPVGELALGSEHLPLRFTLTNTGPVALWFMDGGRGRNELGRDNRFTFVIERDGEQLATRELMDFGGLGVYRRLEPGESHALELDLSHWIRFERPGRYEVRANYEAELMPAQYEPGSELPLGWYSYLTHTRGVTASLALELR